MKKQDKKNLIEKAIELKGRRNLRFISDFEINEMATLDRKKKLAGKTIRIYSTDGFVANSYFGNAVIDYIERTYADEKKQFSIGQVSAKRSNGNGALTTVSGRSF